MQLHNLSACLIALSCLCGTFAHSDHSHGAHSYALSGKDETFAILKTEKSHSHHHGHGRRPQTKVKITITSSQPSKSSSSRSSRGGYSISGSQYYLNSGRSRSHHRHGGHKYRIVLKKKQQQCSAGGCVIQQPVVYTVPVPQNGSGACPSTGCNRAHEHSVPTAAHEHSHSHHSHGASQIEPIAPQPPHDYQSRESDGLRIYNQFYQTFRTSPGKSKRIVARTSAESVTPIMKQKQSEVQKPVPEAQNGNGACTSTGCNGPTHELSAPAAGASQVSAEVSK